MRDFELVIAGAGIGGGALGIVFAAPMVGPDAIPSEAFEDAFVERVMGGPVWSALG